MRKTSQYTVRLFLSGDSENYQIWTSVFVPIIIVKHAETFLQYFDATIAVGSVYVHKGVDHISNIVSC
jgi:hypothetical protein